MRATKVLMAAIATLIGFGSIVGAQSQTHNSLRMGLAVPAGDTPDSVEFALGLDVTYSQLTRNSDLSLSIDYLSITSQEVGNATLVPVFLNYRWRSPSDSQRKYQCYGGAGMGLYLTDSPIQEMNLDKGTSVAWQVFVGAEISSSWLLEARYMASEDPGANGLPLLMFGYRF